MYSWNYRRKSSTWLAIERYFLLVLKRRIRSLFLLPLFIQLSCIKDRTQKGERHFEEKQASNGWGFGLSKQTRKTTVFHFILLLLYFTNFLQPQVVLIPFSSYPLISSCRLSFFILSFIVSQLKFRTWNIIENTIKKTPTPWQVAYII